MAAVTDKGFGLFNSSNKGRMWLLGLIATVAFGHLGCLPAFAADVQAIGVGDTTSEITSNNDFHKIKTAVSSTESSVSSLLDTHQHLTYQVHKLGPTETNIKPGAIIQDGVVIVNQDQGWKSGRASAYTIADNTGGTATASGVELTEHSMTVAVPVSRRDLIGKKVEIYYNGITVTATITDTGGFAPLGRDLDLAGGVWRALGASSTDGWGVRTVSYRFL